MSNAITAMQGTDDGRGTYQRIDTKRLTLMSGTLCRPAAQRHDRASEADVLVRRLSLGVLVCDRVWLNRPVGGFVVGVGVGDRLSLVHLARLVVLRRVDGVDLHRLVADVGDVVPAACRNDDAPAVGYLLVEGQFVLAGSHLGSTAAAVGPNELVGVRVLLESDVAVDRNRHEGDLQVVAAPGHGAVVRVLERLGLQVERLGTGTDVCDAHGLTLASPGPDPPTDDGRSFTNHQAVSTSSPLRLVLCYVVGTLVDHVGFSAAACGTPGRCGCLARTQGRGRRGLG